MDNNNEKKIRTSFSLDEVTSRALKRAAKISRMKDHQLAIIIIKLMIKRSKFNKLNKVNVKYNEKSCKNKIYPYVGENEQFALRQVRAIYGISISYLLCLGVQFFLAALVHKLVHNYATLEQQEWLRVIEEYLTQTKFKKGVSNANQNSFSVIFLWSRVSGST